MIFVANSAILGASKNRIKMNFNDVEVLSFIKIIGKETGRTFVFNNKILKGKKVTLLSNQNFSAKEAIQIFDAVLNINGLATIDEGSITRIVSLKEAKNAPTDVYRSKGNAGAYVTRVIPVKNIKIRTIRSNLQPLVSKNATLVGNDDANVLVIRDIKENTERFAEIVGLIDRKENFASTLNLELVQLSHANATELSTLLNKIFTSKDKKGAAEASKISVLADKRTNTAILIGQPSSLEKIKQLISQLDSKVETDEGNIRVYPLKNASAKKLSEVLQKIAATLKASKKAKAGDKQTTIIPDIPSNSLVIYAEQSEFPTLENVIKKLDIERAQVFIQALIMEVRLDKSLDLGVEWQGSGVAASGTSSTVGTIGGVGATGLPRTIAEVGSSSADTTGAVLGVIGGPITFNGTDYASFNAFIKAIEQDTEIDILSNPQILTLNNEEAEIKVGEIIPTVGSTTVDANGRATTNIEYKEVGISLKITPQVNTDNSIELKIDETSSNLIEKTIGASDQGAITTLNRSLKTKVVVANSQTIVLGGLISDEITDVVTKTPCLGDIPILGWLFKSTRSGTKKTNLLIFLTPTVIRSEEDLNKVTGDVKDRSKNARKGRFRIDVSKEFGVTEIPEEELPEEEPSEEDEED